VVRAARAGKHVITEKPMATSVSECAEMIKVCQDANVQLGVGYRLHYEPYHLELKRLGQQKIFGPVRFIEASLGYRTYDLTKPAPGFNIDDQQNWRLRKNLAGGGPLMDLGVYCVQACRYVLGEEPVSVTAQYGPVHDKIRFAQVEESILWQMQFPGGAVASCSSSYGINTDRFFASADEGFFELSPGLSSGGFAGKTSKGELHFPETDQQATQLDEMGRLILDDKPLPAHITGAEGWKDIKIIQAIYQAAESGQRITLG
jgi:predicted dehydrogenase